MFKPNLSPPGPHSRMDSLPVPVQSAITRYLSGICFKIVKPRKTVLGMWRFRNNQHEITINSNLEGIQFMLTLVHEIAHVRTWDLFKGSVNPHGQEWKDQYRNLMLPLLQGFFDSHIESHLKKYMKNPSASSTRCIEIRRIVKPNSKMLEDVPMGVTFKVSDGREFVKMRKRRVKWECVDAQGKIYIIPGIAPVIF